VLIEFSIADGLELLGACHFHVISGIGAVPNIVSEIYINFYDHNPFYFQHYLLVQ